MLVVAKCDLKITDEFMEVREILISQGHVHYISFTWLTNSVSSKELLSVMLETIWFRKDFNLEFKCNSLLLSAWKLIESAVFSILAVIHFLILP